jgi:hypothetical protein
MTPIIIKIPSLCKEVDFVIHITTFTELVETNNSDRFKFQLDH